MATAAGPLIWPPLPPETFLYRAYPFPDSLNDKTGKPVPKLFYRKGTENGLSVGLSKVGLMRRYPNAAGMCELTVFGVLQCPDPLLVVQDAPDHAEIRGVPTRQEDLQTALRIAKYLVRISEDSALPTSK